MATSGGSSRAATAFESARRFLDAEVQATPSDGRLRSALAIGLAGLGRKADAVREAQRALEVAPYLRAFGGTVVRRNVAPALTMAGAHDAALTNLEVLVTEPAPFSQQLLQLGLDGIHAVAIRGSVN